MDELGLKILIAVPTAEFARKAIFYDYFNMLDKPVGTAVTFAHGQSPARNRNLMIDQGRQHDCSHILFFDDDVCFEKDLLYRLLAHDKDIVSGLYLMRNHPHKPIIFDYADSEGRCMTHFLSGENESQTGLIPIVACGLGACLIKMSVFSKLERPYIRMGELEKDHWCDDIGFCNRAREAGIKLFCDLDVKVGHMASVTVWPEIINGKWHSTYDTEGEGRISILQPVGIEKENYANTK